MQFSHGWFENVCVRQNIDSINLHGEGDSVSPAYVDSSRQSIKEYIKGFQLHDIYNLDEFALFWKLLPSRTLDSNSNSKAAKGDKKSKCRVTGVVCCNADGSHKLKPIIIGHAENPRSLKGVNRNSLGVYYTWQNKAWMEFDIFRNYVDSINTLIKEETPNRTILLLIDGAGAHSGIESMRFSNVQIKLFPPNVTSHIQPLDAGIIRSVKAAYRKRLTREMLDEIEINNKPLVINLKHALSWLAYAVNNVNPRLIRNCWVKTGILSEDHIRYIAALNSRVENATKTDEELIAEYLTQLKRSSPDLDTDATAFIDVDANEATQKEQVEINEVELVRRELEHQQLTFVQHSETKDESDSVRNSILDSSDSDVEEFIPKYNTEQFYQAIKVVQGFLEQQPSDNSANLEKLDSIRTSIRAHRQNNSKQSNLNNWLSTSANNNSNMTD